MAKKKALKRISKAQWLEQSLEILEKGGIDAVKIERLAKELKTSRSGFYWHFLDRNNLLQEILKYWQHEYSEVVITKYRLESPELEDLSPKDRLFEIMMMISDHGLDRFEIHIRSWSDHDPMAADAVARVYQLRFEFIRSIFAEMGFEGIDLDMRTRLWLTYATHGKSMFGTASEKEMAELLKTCHTILICSTQ